MADYKNEQWWIELQKSLEGFNNDRPQMSDKKLSHWNGAKLGGKSAVNSGQLLKAAVNGGKSQGKIRGKINVESGHLNNIRKLAITKEARTKAKANTNYIAIAEKMKKVIYQFDMNGKFVAKFNSVKEASEFVGCSPCSITNVAKGKSKSCKKSIWKYKK
jgi:hypothetical protein